MPAISPVGYIIMFAPLAVSLVMQMAYHRLPVWALVSLFLAYAVLIGLSLSSIFIVFKIGSIIGIFFITAGLYGAMAVLGYTTKMDLSKFGSIMYMLFIGIFIASLVNIFMKSEGLDWIISIIGVVVFTGLTAVKLQEIRYMSQNVEYGSEPASKLAIIAGLQLYILFINLFITLLRLFGQRNE
jgi:FtsH-binding integral membrane protein